jgi:hypothetical protein
VRKPRAQKQQAVQVEAGSGDTYGVIRQNILAVDAQQLPQVIQVGWVVRPMAVEHHSSLGDANTERCCRLVRLRRELFPFVHDLGDLLPVLLAGRRPPSSRRLRSARLSLWRYCTAASASRARAGRGVAAVGRMVLRHHPKLVNATLATAHVPCRQRRGLFSHHSLLLTLLCCGRSAAFASTMHTGGIAFGHLAARKTFLWWAALPAVQVCRGSADAV